jgi:hypothetical protein
MLQRVFVIFSVCLALCGVARSQQQEAFADVALYNSVINQLFPTTTPNLKSHPNNGTIIARFSGSSIHEMQLEIDNVGSSDLQLILWRVPASSPTIWDQLSRSSQISSSRDPKQIASAIHIEKLTIPHAGSQLGDLVRKFSQLRFAPGVNEGVILDSTTYDLWFHSVSNDTHFSLQGSLNGSPSDHPLVLWMISLRSAVTHAPEWSQEGSRGESAALRAYENILHSLIVRGACATEFVGSAN